MQYTRLTKKDRVILRKAALVRWKEYGFQLLITFSLPVVCILVIVLFVNGYELRLMIYQEKSLIKGIHSFATNFNQETIFVISLIAFPAYFLILIANIVAFFNQLIPIHYDLIRGQKRIIPFLPSSYYIEESGEHYIQTSISEHPFLKTKDDMLLNLDIGHQLCMHLSPKTDILLTITQD